MVKLTSVYSHDRETITITQSTVARVGPLPPTTIMPVTPLSVLRGAQNYLQESDKVSLEAADDEQSEEIESMLSSLEVDEAIQVDAPGLVSHLDTLATVGHSVDIDPSATSAALALAGNLKKASTGVILDTTLSNYQRYAWRLL